MDETTPAWRSDPAANRSATTIGSDDEGSAGPATHNRLAGSALLLAALGVAVAQTIVVSALPVFGRHLQVSLSAATWLLTAFMLAAAVATPVAGRLGDLFGYRTVLAGCLCALAAGSAVAALSDRSGWYPGVLAGRALQGLSGGVFPLAFGLARTMGPPHRRAGLVAAISTMVGIGGALGTVVAGPIIDTVGTAGMFWALLAVAVVALGGTTRLPRDRATRYCRARLDIGGGLLLSAALVALLLAVSQGQAWGWASAATMGLFAAASAFGVWFAGKELRSAAPMIDLRLLGRPSLLAVNGATVLISVGMFAAVTLIPRFTQTPPSAGYGFGATVTETGLLMLPVAVPMVLAAPVSARLSGLIGGRTTFQIGAVLACVALVTLGVADRHIWQLCAAGAIVGVAYGFAFGSLGGLVVDAVPTAQTGAATGVNTVLRTLGGAIGAQVSAAFLAANGAPGDAAPSEAGYTAAYLAAAVVALLAVVTSCAISRHGRPGRVPNEA